MPDCKVICAGELEVEVNSGSMTRLAGASEGLTGSAGIHLAIATIPPACASSPRYHVNRESAIYVVRDHVSFRVGKNLEEPLPIGPGDCICVPPDAGHQPVNDGREPWEMLVAPNTLVEIAKAQGQVQKNL